MVATPNSRIPNSQPRTVGYVSHDFEVLMGAYKSDFLEKVRKVCRNEALSPEYRVKLAQAELRG